MEGAPTGMLGTTDTKVPAVGATAVTLMSAPTTLLSLGTLTPATLAPRNCTVR